MKKHVANMGAAMFLILLSACLPESEKAAAPEQKEQAAETTGTVLDNPLISEVEEFMKDDAPKEFDRPAPREEVPDTPASSSPIEESSKKPGSTVLDTYSDPEFDDYPAEDFIAGEAVAPDMKSHPDASRFATAIIAGANKGASFAGHQAVASWGCGSGCEQFVFINAKDGKITWGPVAEYGADYRDHSNLFVINPPQNKPKSLASDENYTTEYHIWDGEKLIPLDETLGD